MSYQILAPTYFLCFPLCNECACFLCLLFRALLFRVLWLVVFHNFRLQAVKLRFEPTVSFF